MKWDRNHEGSLAHECKILVRNGYWLPVILPTTSSLLNYRYSLYSTCHTSTYDSSAFKIEYLKKKFPVDSWSTSAILVIQFDVENLIFTRQHQIIKVGVRVRGVPDYRAVTPLKLGPKFSPIPNGKNWCIFSIMCWKGPNCI